VLYIVGSQGEKGVAGLFDVKTVHRKRVGGSMRDERAPRPLHLAVRSTLLRDGDTAEGGIVVLWVSPSTTRSLSSRRAHRPALLSSSRDSLFEGDDEEEEQQQLAEPTAKAATATIAASSTPPPIPGLFLFPSALSIEVQQSLAAALSLSVWPNNSNQAMLFTSAERPSLPPFLDPFLDLLPEILSPSLPSSLLDLIFRSPLPRQAILNLYRPGMGITPHIDLPHRYEDGIVGMSLVGSTVMEFTRNGEIHSLLLRPGDVYVLSGEARYGWKHGIAYREEDWVRDEDGGEPFWLKRRMRMSITLRRMKEGADLVGEDAE
jgi:alkylated DNA repair dioxygenase AlkB